MHSPLFLRLTGEFLYSLEFCQRINRFIEECSLNDSIHKMNAGLRTRFGESVDFYLYLLHYVL